MTQTTEERYLLDVNVLVALTVERHLHFEAATQWFNAEQRHWTICPAIEMGFLRASVAVRFGNYTVRMANVVLQKLCDLPGFHPMPLDHSWREVTLPFVKRVQGIQQVADAYLLGLAIRENLIVATFDRGFLHLAGKEFQQHVLLLGGA